MDYIIYSSTLDLLQASPTNQLDLGSDHRAVHATFNLARRRFKRSKRTKRGWNPLDLHAYHTLLDEQLSRDRPDTISALEQTVLKTVLVLERQRHGRTRVQQIWEQQWFQDLLLERRNCTTPTQRQKISKQIRIFLRQNLRANRNQRTIEVLTAFRNLSELDMLKFEPMHVCRKVGDAVPTASQFFKFPC